MDPQISLGARGGGLSILWEDGERALCRGVISDGNKSSRNVLTLHLTSTSPRPASIDRLANEFQLKDHLDRGWAARPLEFVREPDRTMLVLEDPGGEVLSQRIGEPMSVDEFLRLAIGTAAALSRVHRHGLVHKDLRPIHILVDGPNADVHITGFGRASRLPRERQTLAPPDFLTETLLYVAPEQTGRMNRSIDSRSDLYALGAIFYQMLTGALPFSSSDPMELVHCHIARTPTPPHERLATIPIQVSNIVTKLLAKTADDRYQTAAGVEYDLRLCLAEWQVKRNIHPFAIGVFDTPDQLIMPEKLYGRDLAITSLMDAYDRVAANGTPELITICGYSGIGKSSVINELERLLLSSRGMFATGKFDEQKRDIPYATLAQAFQRLIRGLLSKSETDLDFWRDSLKGALGTQARLLVDVIPELTLIIGQQGPAPDLSVQQAQQAFQIALRRFVGVFATSDHPLILFLDDLHWADSASLDLLQDLTTHSELRFLLVIGAYRESEVNPNHPLVLKLEAIRDAGCETGQIVLQALSPKQCEEFVADALHRTRSRAASLARILHQKTGGNPFFLKQFLSGLYEEGLVSFDPAKREWFWDPSEIRRKQHTENVVELMAGKLVQLPTETRIALQQLACLGTSATTSMLSTVLSMSETRVDAALWEATRREFVEHSDGSYRFFHDRILEAAYSLIPEQTLAHTHLLIGRLLVSHTPVEQREEIIFDAVTHLNRARELIVSTEEKEQLSELNLMAGKRARASTAYHQALKFFEVGASLLTTEAWENRHETAFALEFYRAECEFLIGEMRIAEKRLNLLSSRCANGLERANVACLRIDLHTTLDECDEAVDVCIGYLRFLGVNWVAHPKRAQVKREYEKIWKNLGSRTIEQLSDLPLTNDAIARATLDVLTRVLPSALFTDANLLSLAICHSVNISLEKGHGDGSCVAYVFFSKIAGPQFNDFDAGYRFANLGYELVEKRDLERFRAPTLLWFTQFSLMWTKHVRFSRTVIMRAFETATKVGDLNFTVYCCDNLNTNFLAAGDHLVHAERQAEAGLVLAERARFDHIVDIMKVQLGVIRNLRGLTYKFGSFDDEQVSENDLEARYANDPATKQPECWYWIRKLQTRFFAGDFPAALNAATKARDLLWTSAAMFEIAEYHYYHALSLAATQGRGGPPVAKEDMIALVAHHNQLVAWANICSENFENRAALVGAELARLEGRDDDAGRLYELAIRSARANGFIHNEAIAYETAARFYGLRGFEEFFKLYLSKSRDSYLHWGAHAKVKQLESLYPMLLNPTLNPVKDERTGAERFFDADAVLKASQALSSQILLPDLVERLMTLALQNAGADRGLLILSQDNSFSIEAEALTEGEAIVLRHDRSAAPAIPQTIVRYVIRTHETVIIDDAAAQHIFSSDPYIGRQKPRSVLCLPLIRQGVLGGLLYLENSLASHVFTEDRARLLEVIGTQAAISLENTRLYADLQEREARIRRLFNANIIGIFTWSLDGTITDANDAFLQIVGYQSDDLASGSMRWKDLMPSDWDPENDRIIGEMLATGVATPFEGEYVRKDGSRVPALIGAALFDGRPTEGVAFVIDLTELRRAEWSARDSERRYHDSQLALAHANRVTTLGHLAASIAHELSQPLSGVVVNAEAARLLLNERPNLPEAREALGRIVRDGTRASQVFSRIRTLIKRKPPERSWLDMNVVVGEVIGLTSGEAHKNGILLKANLTEGLPLTQGDRVQLQQVLLNLIMNALEAIKQGSGGRGEVQATTNFSASGEIRISVRDTGPGIEPENLELIFGAFYTTKAEGLGMGLSICRSIIEAHGGKLWAETAFPVGTTFNFVLPAPE
ncbi:ATP-binding sensor histidine kinase [Rhizobium leguminosarum]|uniref:histidine kinase n=1 Tax=Rhizobium leguminosarum TaxID=384 RepID=A0A2K9Z2Y8_RHILE|nr:ATP-binding sensor histidine kinase [Rhizobium leguminosarum]AUW42607.1 Protein kinase [Rhizobium leguminosarum]